LKNIARSAACIVTGREREYQDTKAVAEEASVYRCYS
jgi:hypothetical protein